jgi:hypothetical protein
MPRKCPPGVICFENVTIFFILVLVGLIILYINTKRVNNNNVTKEIIVQEERPQLFGMFPRPSFSFSNVASDVFLNPYQAPLRDDRVFRNDMSDPRGVPINISTRAVDAEYRQVGILTRMGAPEMILPLMGRPLYVSRDKWNFYTMSDKNSMVKLPISYKGRSCTNEYGCDNLYNGDVVYVEGYNDTFKVTIYDNQVMRYIPYL